MGIWKTFFNNTRKPEGLLGRCMVDSMNHAHAALADWGLSRLPETGPSQIAELGCGGGRNIRALLRKYPAATITALDYSEISVEKAKRVNREGLQAGRCQILQGDVSRLPFGDGSFDLATAFETVYFWPGPVESFREVYRTLQPGGIFLIVESTMETSLPVFSPRLVFLRSSWIKTPKSTGSVRWRSGRIRGKSITESSL